MPKIMINRTPHKVKDITGGAEFAPALSKDILRVQLLKKNVDEIMGAAIYSVESVIDGSIPEFDENIVYIVSKRVALALYEINPERTDFVFPGDIVHGDKMNDKRSNREVIGCRGFVSLSYDKKNRLEQA
jgi:hypothetical protein